MRLLLDTHVVLWWDSGARLSREAAEAIRDADEVYVSAASVWEVEIKRALGKIHGSRSLSRAAAESGFLELPVAFRHAEALVDMPAHHRDPFDRLLVAQAIIEQMHLVTRDQRLLAYPVTIIKA